MALWGQLAIWAGATLLGELLSPKAEKPKPSGLGEFQVPTADGSRAIPVIFGTCLLRGPNLLWYGDLVTKPIYKETGGLFGSGLFSSVYQVGWKYYLGVHLGLCHGPVDQVRSIRFGDRSAHFTSSVQGDHLRVVLDDARLFGGIDAEGGVSGDVDFYLGTSTQGANDYLQSKITADLPGYRTLCHAVFRRVYFGTMPQVKDVAFELSRYPNSLGLGGNKHVIGTYDANPACMLYEASLDRVWGLGIPSSRVDLASFQAAGEVLYSEGLGLSLQVDTPADGANAIDEILRHIDGDMYTDPATGLWTLVLARKDYDPATLPVFDESSIEEIELTRQSWSELANVVQVRYVSRADGYSERIAQQQNLALVQIRDGERVPQALDFRGISNAAAANGRAALAIKAVSYPLAKGRVVLNRKAYQLRPGSVFKVNHSRLKLSDLVLRAGPIDYGELLDGKIAVDCFEDIFVAAPGAFPPPPDSGWTDPVGDVLAPVAQGLIEAPYHLLGSADRFVAAMAVRSGGGDLGYEIWSDRTGGINYVLTNQAGGFTPSGLLTAAYAKSGAYVDATGFTANTPYDLDDLVSVTQQELEAGVNLLLIDDELMAFRTVVNNGDGTYTIQNVWRGVLDTVPADHAIGARVWFIAPSGLSLVDPTAAYSADGTIRAKLLPFNLRRTLDLASATALTLATTSRAQKPYPPGHVKIDVWDWPTTLSAGIDIPVTWAHRHRAQQYADHKIVSQGAGDYVATPEGDYTVEVRVGGVLKRTVGALTGTSWTWTAAMQSTDGAAPGSAVSIRVIPKNGSLTGTYQERSFSLV